MPGTPSDFYQATYSSRVQFLLTEYTIPKGNASGHRKALPGGDSDVEALNMPGTKFQESCAPCGACPSRFREESETNNKISLQAICLIHLSFCGSSSTLDFFVSFSVALLGIVMLCF